MSWTAPQIEATRGKLLADVFDEPFFGEIKARLVAEKQAGHQIFPPSNLIFNAFAQTPVDNVRVVLLGQDPYHGAGQAHGLSFSVPAGVALPPSLQNIYKEIADDVGWVPPKSGDLTYLAQQGVLLLNAILTVRANSPASHQEFGRQQFTDAVLQKLSHEKSGLVFLLRGNFARSKKELIDSSKHLILEAAHPSPFSAYKWFFGCKHFSMTNQFLILQNKEPISWFPQI